MNQDPKYQFGDTDRIFHREGKYLLPKDEPVILFRGKDLGTIIAMEEYKKFMQHIEQYTNKPEAKKIAKQHIKSITERIETILKFQNEHPERIGLGCHTCKPDIKAINIEESYKTY